MENAVVAGSGEKKNMTKKKPNIELIEKDRTGQVKFFNRVRGWGFIIQDLEEEDAFVHFDWIKTTKKFKKLEDHDFVIYDLYENHDDEKRKWQARNVRKIKETLLD